MGGSGKKWEFACFTASRTEIKQPSFLETAVVFTGSYHRTLDGKLRVLLPKRLRGGIADEDQLFLTPGTDRCLEMHSDQSLNELAAKAAASNAGSQNIRSFLRLFYARAEQCDVDNQGRIRIPAALAVFAGLEKEIVIVGAGLHWELWDSGRWKAYLAQNDGAFDSLTAITFDGLGPNGLAASDGLKADSVSNGLDGNDPIDFSMASMTVGSPLDNERSLSSEQASPIKQIASASLSNDRKSTKPK